MKVELNAFELCDIYFVLCDKENCLLQKAKTAANGTMKGLYNIEAIKYCELKNKILDFCKIAMQEKK